MKISNYFIVFLFVLVGCSTKSKTEVKTMPTDPVELKIQQLLSEMTLEEKVGQLNLRGRSSRGSQHLPEELLQRVRDGEIGAFLNVMDTTHMRELQRVAVEESKHGIPLLFARDVIHGFKTLFPIPLGQAASFHPEIVEEGSRVAAMEASSVGIRWTFAPMLDICQDSRWGRIAESPGEDPYLATQMANAYVNGFQGEDLSDPTRMAACAKHFLGYGAAIGGRDYNTAIMSDELLYNLYLPPFVEAVNENVATVMSSFNEVNGIPATGNHKILTSILREQLGFNGFVVSDWESTEEMIAHGFAENEKHAAELSAIAGLDMEMTSTTYEDYLIELIEEGKVDESRLDFYVANILRIKFRLNLFDNPYIPDNHPGELYAEEHLQSAKQAAIESSVLLKNESILPLTTSNILLTGPLANKGREQLGTWSFDGEEEPSVTPVEAMPNRVFVEGLSYSRDKNDDQFPEVLAAAEQSDVVVFIGGEEAILSGEAHSRADIKLPGAQEELILKLAATGKPIVLVIMAGRPIDLTNILNHVDAVLMMWHPGTMGGPALQEMLFGTASPSGRLPVSWPKTAGQLPYYYNHKSTGRPANPESYVGIDDIPIGAWQSSLGNESHYLDAGFTPLYPFGYGLSYTSFSYGEVSTSKNSLTKGENLSVSTTVTNTGERAGQEVVQLYIRDVFGRVTRPVKELKGFQKIELSPGESKVVTFSLSYEDVEYHDSEGNYGVEPGEIQLFVGPHSAIQQSQPIQVK